MTDNFVQRFDPTDVRLGRHVNHDPRSRNFAYEADDLSTLVSTQHVSKIPVLDQGNLGSCTGNASTKCLSYKPFWATGGKTRLSRKNGTKNEQYAIGVYSAATKIDAYDGSYPPNDTGSDGISVAKVLVSRKAITGYTHAFSLEAALTALTKQPVIVGTSWHGDMFTPSADGKLRITGAVEGGHEYCLDEIDVENKRVWMQNSWNTSWGIEGRAWMTWDDLGTLLADNGDCTIFTPKA